MPSSAVTSRFSCELGQSRHRRVRCTNRADWNVPDTASASELSELWESDLVKFWDQLAQSIEAWGSTGDAQAGGMLGHWLTWIRAHGMSNRQVAELTVFLAEPRFPVASTVSRSVRRYPTGGISEKQALLLPAVLRMLSESANLHSSFLIARRLGHTGGTADKLRILPGFVVPPASGLRGWDGSKPPVRYFTADATFCPRDEVLYFLRGETGTVRQLGLIVASIVAKQYALQADKTLLDVLHGEGAFFQSLEAAQAFCSLAGAISASLGFRVEFALRPTAALEWRSIGNAAEIAEVLSSLTLADEADIAPRSELAQAKTFAAHLAAGPDLSARELSARVDDAWRNGDLLESLCTLWGEHGAHAISIATVTASKSQAVLGGLNSVHVGAERSGFLRSANVVELADIVNTRLNAYKASNGGLPGTAGVGGLTLGTALGTHIERGATLFEIHSSDAIGAELVEDIRSNLSVAEEPR